MMALKDLDTILTDLADNESRSITEEVLRDAFNSVVAVGGTMHATDISVPITAAWAAFGGYESSVDTKGLQEDLVAGTYTIGSGANGAAGVYAVDASICVESPAAGRIDVSLTLNGGLTPYRAVIDVAADTITQFVVQGSGNLAEGDAIGLAWKGSGSTTLTVPAAQFRAVKI